jgi:hypothetical protein
MRISASGTETYLYLNGLRTDKPVRFSENLELLPAHPDCYAQLFLGLGKSDLDISLISLFLPRVHSQLRVQGRDGKETVTRAWNSLWDCLVIGAITGNEVVCNLQSDLPVEQLKPDSTLTVTNYHLRGLLNHAEVCSISDSHIAWIQEHLERAVKMLKFDSFQNAIHCLASYTWHPGAPARFAIIWSGIEGLFGADSELAFRISVYVARFLEPENRAKQVEIFKRVKKLYGLRSKAVHGAKMKGDRDEGVEASAELLRSLVLQCVALNAMPDAATLAP